MKYVIIGNGPAGVAAATTIRSLDQKGDITIISAEGYDFYSKCLLPDFLSGAISEQQLFVRSPDFYDKNRIQLLRNRTVTEVDTAAKAVSMIDSGNKEATLYYDKLLVASGGKPFLPPIPGLKESNMFQLGTLDDVKKLKAGLQNAHEIVVIGAGYVGLEIASSLAKLGKKVTVVEKLPDIVGGQLDALASRVLRDGLAEEGVSLMLNTGVTGVSRARDIMAKLFNKKRKYLVALSSRQEVTADAIVVATGSGPNLAFMWNSGIRMNKGILVNRHMQTTVRDVYAAGDVVESIDAVTGNTALSPIWPNAVIQGAIAGSNMAGVPRDFDPQISMQNASEFRDIPMIAMGLSSADGPEYEEFVDDRSNELIYRKLVLKDNKVVGMIFLGDIHNAGVIGALMRNKANVARFKENMLSPSFCYSEVGELIGDA